MSESVPMEKPDYEIAREEMRALLDAQGVTIACEFVPLSKSRNAREAHPTVNWLISVKRQTNKGKLQALEYAPSILTCDYSQGIAHLECKGRKRPYGWEHTGDGVRAVRDACENGKGYYAASWADTLAKAPTREDVLSSLASDASAIDHATYEDFAAEYGYDADSRKGEAIYRACLETALKLRNAFGEATFSQLRELAGRF